MKKVTILFLVALFTFLIIQSCQKNDPSALSVTASKTTVNVNELDTLTVNGATASDSVKWNIRPESFVWVNYTKSNKRIIQFTQAGNYAVNVVANGNTATAQITVKDATHQTSGYTSIPITGNILLMPRFYKSQIGDTTYLAITAQTDKIFSCGNVILNYTYGIDASNNFSIDFINAQQPPASQCAGNGTSLYSAATYFTFAHNKPSANGTYQFNVTSNGKVYTGNVVFTDQTITFNWPYTSGVVISPLQISR
jgi:hypothetical protein